MPYELIGSIGDYQCPAVLEVNTAGHFSVTTTARYRTNVRGIQRSDDMVDAMADTLNASIERLRFATSNTTAWRS